MCFPLRSNLEASTKKIVKYRSLFQARNKNVNLSTSIYYKIIKSN